MIPLNEFRIGIIVHATYAGNIYNELAEKVITKEDFAIENLEHWFFPIPLSPEWLERLGAIKEEISGYVILGATYWKIGNIRFYEHNGRYCLPIGERISSDVGRSIIEFDKVHELQNIFALTGTELTLKT